MRLKRDSCTDHSTACPGQLYRAQKEAKVWRVCRWTAVLRRVFQLPWSFCNSGRKLRRCLLEERLTYPAPLSLGRALYYRWMHSCLVEPLWKRVRAWQWLICRAYCGGLSDGGQNLCLEQKCPFKARIWLTIKWEEHTLAVCIGVFVIFSCAVIFFLPTCCAWFCGVFFFFFFGDGIVRVCTCIIWLIDCAVCGDFFFCYSLNLCEMRSVRWWKFLDILHCWCTCVLSIAFWLGSEI